MLRRAVSKIAGCGFSYPTKPESVIVQETIGDSAAFKHVGNLAVGIGDYCQRVAPSEPQQNLAGAGTNIAPVRGNAGGIYQGVAQSIVMDAKFLEQVGIEKIPEAVIGFAIVLQDLVEFFLGFALDGVPLLESWGQLSLVKGSQDMLPVREEKGVPDIEEDCFQWQVPSSHGRRCYERCACRDTVDCLRQKQRLRSVVLEPCIAMCNRKRRAVQLAYSSSRFLP